MSVDISTSSKKESVPKDPVPKDPETVPNNDEGEETEEPITKRTKSISEQLSKVKKSLYSKSSHV